MTEAQAHMDATAPQSLMNSKDAVVVRMQGVEKHFGSKEVLRDLNLELRAGENLVILGRSGEGKSVAIKCIAGLLEQDKGTITVLGQDVKSLHERDLKALRTRMGFLFQNAALYDSMTVRDNLAFPLQRVLHVKSEAEIDRRVAEVLDNVGLADAADKMPSDLSGGMRKRIGLARTIIMRPEIIMYDEPTTGLDPITSREISELIMKMQKKYHASSIIITHDLECARITGDRLLVLRDGAFIAEGTFEELSHAEDEFVQAFFKQT
jgi:phospholipid/cholesterol/gamma-HCH transport system ATP-binding protein